MACHFIEKETLAKMFSCEFCEVVKNTFFTEHLWMTASEIRMPTTWKNYFPIAGVLVTHWKEINMIQAGTVMTHSVEAATGGVL